MRSNTPWLLILTLALAVLKTTGTIHWSWWWVTAPLWGPWVLFGVFFGALGALVLAQALLHHRAMLKRSKR